MNISSPMFTDSAIIPDQYTCRGNDTNPPLNFSETPDAAKSLVLIVDDPDAPAGTWTHWIMWNIPPGVTGIAENSMPTGAISGLNTSGTNGYEGPCPPSGTHRYFFKLYALDTTLDLPADSKVEQLKSAMEGHILDQAQVVGKVSN